MTINALAVVAFALRFFFGTMVLALGVWAYRRFRLPAIPWLMAYFILGVVLTFPLSQLAKRVVDHASASESSPLGAGSSLGEFIAAMTCVSTIVTTVAQALIGWFIVAELVDAYSKCDGNSSFPAILSFPRRHSAAVGSALLVCVVANPLLWLVFAARA